MPCHIANCPFDVNEHQLISISGEKWCIYHAPFDAVTGNGPKSEWDDKLINSFNQGVGQYLQLCVSRNRTAILDGVVFPARVRFDVFPETTAVGAEFRGDLELDAIQLTAPLDFSNSTFYGSVTLRGTTARGYVDFYGSRIANSFDAVNATFESGAYFKKVTFGNNANFSNARFDKPCQFDGCAIGGAADFYSAKFERDETSIHPHSFKDISFSKKASFEQARFSHWTSFNDTSFNEEADFTSATFTQADFHNVRFSKVARFEGTQFSLAVIFDDAIFEGAAVFEEAKLKGAFRNAQFHNIARFAGAVFGDISFEGTTFLGDANFSSYVTRGTRGYKQEPHGDEFHALNFSGVRFEKSANFINRKFRQSVSFRNAIFGQAPEFHQAELHQDTDFQDASFKDLSGAAAQEYRTLKLAMEKVRNRRDEGQFFALEQTCLRKVPNVPVVTKILSALYEGTSNYGQSVGIPIAWFALMNVGVYLIYVWMTPEKCLTGGSEILIFTVGQIVRPLAIWSGGYHGSFWYCFDPSLQLWSRLISTVQALANIGFLAMTLLAIRWNFRRG